MHFSWTNAYRCIAHLGIAGVLVMVFAMALSFVVPRSLYNQNYGFVPGQYVGYRLNEVAENPQNTCVILGASTAREGIDVDVLNELSETHYVNMGTTASWGSLGSLYIQLKALKAKEENVQCIVFAMHPFFVSHFTDQSFEMLNNDYASQLSLGQAYTLPSAWKTHKPRSLVAKYALPLAQHSEQLRKQFSFWLYKMHRAMVNGAANVALFEARVGELDIKPHYFLYDGKPNVLEKVANKKRQQMAEKGAYVSKTYEDPFVHQVFAGMLNDAKKLAKQVIILELPSSYVFTDADDAARPSYYNTIKPYAHNVSLLRCEVNRLEHHDLFHDYIHLNAKGRKELSKDLAAALKGETLQMCKHVRLHSATP